MLLLSAILLRIARQRDPIPADMQRGRKRAFDQSQMLIAWPQDGHHVDAVGNHDGVAPSWCAGLWCVWVTHEAPRAALPIDDVTAIVAISQRCAHQDSRTGDLHHPQAHLVCGAIAPHDVAILTRGFEGRLVIT